MIIDTYTPHRVKVSKDINFIFPEIGHNYPQPRFVIAGESTNFIPQAEFISTDTEAQSPTELISSNNGISSLDKFVPPDRQVYQTEYLFPQILAPAELFLQHLFSTKYS